MVQNIRQKSRCLKGKSGEPFYNVEIDIKKSLPKWKGFVPRTGFEPVIPP